MDGRTRPGRERVAKRQANGGDCLVRIVGGWYDTVTGIFWSDKGRRYVVAVSWLGFMDLLRNLSHIWEKGPVVS